MSAGSEIEIRTLRLDEVPAAVEMLARAFHDDPGALIIEPDPGPRPIALGALFAPVVRQAVPLGHVAAAVGADGRIVGVATFLPPGHDTASEAELVAAGLPDAEAAVPAAAERMGPMVAFLEAQHVAAISGPHWRLEFFGVEPSLQGSGVGNDLIVTGHTAADAAGERTYLETFTTRNVAWYERRGYRVVIEGIVPGTDVPVWGLIREPSRA
jgi:ribosomal protein S18 acetylase RimI-like enzyme